MEINKSVLMLTPNWRNDKTPIAVDTARPPVTPPLEWLYLKRRLGKHGFSSKILDCYAKDLSACQTGTAIEQLNPDAIILPTAPNYLYWRCPPLNLHLVSEHVRMIRKISNEILIVVVGPHCSSDPQWVLDRTGSSLVLSGEPDSDSLPNVLIAALENSFSTIQALTNPKQLIGVDYSNFELSEYDPHIWPTLGQEWMRQEFPGNYATIEFARGCPHDCDFCLRDGFRRKLRIKSQDIFQNEVEQLVRLGVSYVFFIDENFGQPWNKYFRAAQILNDHGIVFGFQARPEALADRKAETLAELGAVYVEIGLESTTPAELQTSNKFDSPREVIVLAKKLKSVFRWCSINCFDVARLSVFDQYQGSVDSEGATPAPLIPYPGTLRGDRILKEVQTSLPSAPAWEAAESLFVLWSLQAGVKHEFFQNLDLGTPDSPFSRIQLQHVYETLFLIQGEPVESVTRYRQGKLY